MNSCRSRAPGGRLHEANVQGGILLCTGVEGTRAWPETITAYETRVAKLLASPRMLELLLTLMERPIRREDLPVVTGRSREESERRMRHLMEEGVALAVPVATPQGETLEYRAATRHLGDTALHSRDRLAFRIGALGLMDAYVAEGRRALRQEHEMAKAGLGLVTLPDDPATLAAAVGILAEAEDRLRALGDASALPANMPRLRIGLFLASALPPTP